MNGIVITHGRDNPFGNKLSMGRQFENGIRSGLDRVGASYAMTVPCRFAFYGDLWRPDGGEEWRVASKDLDAVDPEALAMGVAEELLDSAGAFAPGEKGLWDSVTAMIAATQGHVPSRLAETMLRHFAGDTAEYLAYEKLRELTIARVVQQIENITQEDAVNGVVLMAHSMGTIVCYDLLMLHPDLPVRAFISFGSPLGLEVILRSEGADPDVGKNTAPFPPSLPRWINVYNKEDLVASVRLLAPLYVANDGRAVEDVDTGKMRTPGITKLFMGHDPDNYLTSLAMGNALRSVMEGN